VQQIYRGWALLGVVVIGALVFTAVYAVVVRKQRKPFTLAVIAFLCLAGTQAVFWTFTFPANQLTANWTVLPQDWTVLRRQWEYSHATSAFLNLAALVALILSVLVGEKQID
jgi:hypothetical protein